MMLETMGMNAIASPSWRPSLVLVVIPRMRDQSPIPNYKRDIWG